MIYILMDQWSESECLEMERGKGIDITRQDTNDEKIKPMDIKEMTSMNEQRADIFHYIYFLYFLKYSSCWAFVILTSILECCIGKENI